MNAEEQILSDLKDGTKLSDVYNNAVAFVKKERPDLVRHSIHAFDAYK